MTNQNMLNICSFRISNCGILLIRQLLWHGRKAGSLNVYLQALWSTVGVCYNERMLKRMNATTNSTYQ